MGTGHLFVRDILTYFALFLEKSDILLNLHRVFFLEIGFFIVLEGDIVDLVEEVFKREFVDRAKDDGFGSEVKMVLADKFVQPKNGILGKFL